MQLHFVIQKLYFTPNKPQFEPYLKVLKFLREENYTE